MGACLRALRAILLLAGFYLLALVILGALVGIDIAVWTRGVHLASIKLTVVLALLGFPILRGVFTFGTGGGDTVPGLPVTEAGQPELWRTVRGLAEQSGTRAPDEILLTGEVNAAVAEDARLLGLVPGRRRLFLGVPLLAGLTEPQLHSVIAHELGHYGNSDTRLAGITRRGRDCVGRTVEAFKEREEQRIGKERSRQEQAAAKALRKGRRPRRISTKNAGLGYRLMARPFQVYARFYLRATSSVGRQQELAADLIAAKVAGRDATASALRRTAVLDAVQDFYLNSYATMGVSAGLLPPRGEVFGGLRHLLADPRRRMNLAELHTTLPPAEATPYDSHPPVAERVRLIEALPDDGRTADGARPALALLRDTERVLAEVESAVLTPEALALERVTWQELVHRAMYAQAQEAAQPLRSALAAAGMAVDTAPADSAPAELAALLDAADAGQLWLVADRLPKSPEAARATGRAAREFLRPALEAGTRRLAQLALVEHHGARWQLSWSDRARLTLPASSAWPDPDALEEALAAAVRAATADTPDTTPLRTLLAH